jgi:hypothetical protein
MNLTKNVPELISFFTDIDFLGQKIDKNRLFRPLETNGIVDCFDLQN